MSSFQLEKMKVNGLDYGILLNIDIDHLDHHGNFESYKAAKEKILLAKKVSHTQHVHMSYLSG